MSSSDHSLADLAARLDRLEAQNGRLVRQNRWLKHLAALALVLSAGAVLLGKDPSAQAQEKGDAEKPVVRALEVRSLTVRDANGKVRAYLGPIQKGGMRFEIVDAKGKQRFSATAADVGTLVSIDNEEGGRGIAMFSRAGNAQVNLHGGVEKASVALLGQKDQGSITVDDPQSKAQVFLQVKAQEPAAILFNGAGRPVWNAPPSKLTR